MESFQKRARERRKREKQLEKQVKQQERDTSRQLRPSGSEPHLIEPQDDAPAAKSTDEEPPR